LFIAGENTSYVITSTQTESAFNPAHKISELLKQIRIKCVKLIPFVFGVIFVFTSAIFGIKKGLKIVAAPFLAALISLMVISSFGYQITLFHILGIFLIIGFGIDYSVFGMNGEEKTSDAITISACSSAFSFLLLAFTSFGVISSLGLILFVGIVTSYLLSSMICKS
jgi:predicted exporter